MLRFRAVVASVAVAGLAAAAAAAVHFGPRLYYRMVPPKQPGHAIVGQEAAAFGDAARRFRGRIVWSSNRSGNHEIYLLDLRGARPRVERLTDDPHVDSFPRFSPDGSKILFNRSRETWVSDRDPEPWDVWIMDADGRHARPVAELGFHASFAPDGRSVVFARAAQVVRRSLDDGTEEVLVDSGKVLGGWGHEPELRDHRLAVTIRGALYGGFGIYDATTRKLTAFPGDSCQIAWWPGQERLIWIEGHRGNGGTRVAWGPSDGRRVETLIDLPGVYSHEYFPRLSRDGAWLAWAASAGDHEPGRADYEIFLWKLGEPWDHALRLTHHTGNDQWPDLDPR
ncbi:MAG: PD40 domain-containing protein [Deltaproteobacteria bacterium]|nr:PD40 domain-containing protein [Deltaproteobacteria bacterium]